MDKKVAIEKIFSGKALILIDFFDWQLINFIILTTKPLFTIQFLDLHLLFQIVQDDDLEFI